MLFTIEEVSERLKCSDDQVRVLIRSGELPSTNIGSGSLRRFIRVPGDALEAFISRRTSSVQPIRTKKVAPEPTKEWV